MKEIADYLYRAQLRGELRFLLIGGRALEAHGYVRNTKDVDFLIAHTDIPVMNALLGKAGFECLRENQICSRWQHPAFVFEDVDVMFVAPEVFDKLVEGAVELVIGNARLWVPAIKNLISLKLHAIHNNPDRLLKDGLDIQQLRHLHPKAVPAEEFRQLCQRFATEEVYAKLSVLNS
jgi:hypothetical protein